MKKINTLLKIHFICLILSLCACQEDDKNLFDKPAKERFKEAVNSLQKTLQVPDYGWKTTYFTDDGQLGGYHFLFDFENDTQVTMASDFSTSDFTKKQSEYTVKIGTTLTLSFTSKNSIHKLSDSANYPKNSLKGKGFKGDFEFLYYGKKDGDLIFKTVRGLKELRFTPATKADWDDLSKNYNATKTAFEHNPVKSIFRVLKIGNILYNFNYDSTMRFVSALTNNPTVPQDKKTLRFGVGFAKDAVLISPAIEVNGATINQLNYDNTTDTFSASVGGKKQVEIYYTDAPIQKLNPFGFPRKGKNNMRINRTNSSYVASDKSSTAFVNLFNQWKADVKNKANYTVTRFYIRTIHNKNPYIQIYVQRSGTTARARYGCTKKLSTDSFGNQIVQFTLDAAHTSDKSVIDKELKKMVKFICRKDGFYIEKYPTDYLTDFSLIAVNDAKYRIHWYDF